MNTEITTATIGAETPEQAVARLTAEAERLEAEIRVLNTTQIESWDDPRVAALGEKLYESAISEGVRREYETMANAVGLPRPRAPYRVHMRISLEYPVIVEAMSEEDAQAQTLEAMRENGSHEWLAEQSGISIPPGIHNLAVSPRLANRID
ncbi:hypothetical protein [Agrococcus casei]|uniref:Uncharacterized protein n=1 Tax=Agrococcus casei LMG 22410 TaxID=1255656 RepID=A0A1R4FIG1_9MICO|nr:hypothetical protein [Agrococcus casei]SJM55676.1 hypothetical protein CZ674_04655 [Agrococcus casei LMG 22410]